MEEKELCYVSGVTNAVLMNLLHSGILQRAEKIPPLKIRNSPNLRHFPFQKNNRQYLKRYLLGLRQAKGNAFCCMG